MTDEIQKQLDGVISHLEKEEGITVDNYREKDSEGLGDTLHKVFKKFGITEERIGDFFGLTEGCGCEGRRKFLNQVFPYRKYSSQQNKVE